MKDGCPGAVKDGSLAGLCCVPYNGLFSSLSLIGNLRWGNACPVG